MKKINGKYYGINTDVNSINGAKDLDIFNCLDTGVRYFVPIEEPVEAEEPVAE